MANMLCNIYIFLRINIQNRDFCFKKSDSLDLLSPLNSFSFLHALQRASFQRFLKRFIGVSSTGGLQFLLCRPWVGFDVWQLCVSPFDIRHDFLASICDRAEEGKSEGYHTDWQPNGGSREGKDCKCSDKGNRIQDVDKRSKNLAVEVRSKDGTKRSHEHDNWGGNYDVIPGVNADCLLDDPAPVNPHQRRPRHHDNGSGRGRLFRDAEQKRQDAETADVNSTTNNGGKDATNEAAACEGEYLPRPHVWDGPVRLALVEAVQEEEGEREREPHAYKNHFLHQCADIWIDELQPNYHPNDSSPEAEHYGVPLQLHAHPEYGERRCWHTTGLHQ